MILDEKKNKRKESFIRPIKTYVIRAGRMSENERRNYSDLHGTWCIPFENNKLDFVKIFNNTNPVVMEIGFGMGQATAELADVKRDVNFIGSEVHVPGIGRILGEIQKRNLKNLFIIEHDALEILDVMIPPYSLSGFHIFFPDPWPKKKHHKRRLVKRPTTDLLASKLLPGGYIYFATDWEEYAFSALEELTNTEGIRNRYSGFSPRQEWRPMTKFEKKGLDEGRKIYEIFFEKE